MTEIVSRPGVASRPVFRRAWIAVVLMHLINARQVLDTYGESDHELGPKQIYNKNLELLKAFEMIHKFLSSLALDADEKNWPPYTELLFGLKCLVMCVLIL